MLFAVTVPLMLLKLCDTLILPPLPVFAPEVNLKTILASINLTVLDAVSIVCNVVAVELVVVTVLLYRANLETLGSSVLYSITGTLSSPPAKYKFSEDT